MEALENDANQPSQSSKPLTSNDDLSRSPPGEYTDELPLRGLNYMALDKPPYLPPQLLNIVLNKDTSSKCEPTLLPEPNHVMLKHLYALSIRVISFTFLAFGFFFSHRKCTSSRHRFPKGWCHGLELHNSVQAEVHHNMLLQADLRRTSKVRFHASASTQRDTPPPQS